MSKTKAAIIRRFFSGRKLFFALLFIPALAFSQTNAIPPANPSPSAKAHSVVKDPGAPAFKFKEQAWDFGNIPQGIPVTHIFEYSNSGMHPLVLSQATASCGCTTPVWTKEPVLPGKTGTVAVTYNSAKEGAFTKTVTLLSNIGEPKYLVIKGNVIANPVDNSNAPNKQ